MEEQAKQDGAVIGKEQYFQAMTETWLQTRDYMLSKLSQLEASDKKASSIVLENKVVKKRLAAEHPKTRPFLLRLSFEACNGGDWKKTIPACAAVEFLNISTYVINAIFDEKGGKHSKEETEQYYITGMILRDLASECLSETTISLSPEENKTVQQNLIDINKICYLGQHIDMFQLTKEQQENFSSFQEMKELYLERCKRICGQFMGNIASIGATLANATFEQNETLKNYGLNYGTGVQIVNDLGDFVFGNSTAVDFEKAYQDQYSDIKNGRLTYPVILGLEMQGQNPVQLLLGKKNAKQEELSALTKYLLKSNIVREVKELSKKNFFVCKEELKKFPESKARTFLSIMTSMLRSNKYFTFFSKLDETN